MCCLVERRVGQLPASHNSWAISIKLQIQKNISGTYIYPTGPAPDSSTQVGLENYDLQQQPHRDKAVKTVSCYVDEYSKGNISMEGPIHMYLLYIKYLILMNMRCAKVPNKAFI